MKDISSSNAQSTISAPFRQKTSYNSKINYKQLIRTNLLLEFIKHFNSGSQKFWEKTHSLKQKDRKTARSNSYTKHEINQIIKVTISSNTVSIENNSTTY